MAGKPGRPGAAKKSTNRPGTGGKNKRGLEGKGPTPKAEDRKYHKAYKGNKPADEGPQRGSRNSRV